jgi:hypothetical protein
MAEGVDEAVRGQQSDGQLQDFGAHLALLFEGQGGGFGGGGAQCQRGAAVAGMTNLFDRGATPGVELVLSRKRRIEHVGGIGEDIGVDPHGAADSPQLAHIAGFHPARYEVHLVALAPRGFREVLDDPLHHVGKARYVRAYIARCVSVNQVFAGRDLAFFARLSDDLHDIVANGFRKTSGVNSDDIGVIQGKHVGDGL